MITSSRLWEIVDSWGIIKARPIQKFTMLLDVLTEAGVKVVFNNKERDPINESNDPHTSKNV